ncbi:MULTISPECIES: LacI family DNA-binding transcriptional regulator [Brevibacterium]|uniref:LacI family DNA-binding transcriptional regulator n=1 Tax=Brevibacterium gallinarum TaxID=2762220 RepID=A0ABR8WVC8_9MICO|nr:LacI family DNA-binding transcriptional regulator [Brevibacterium gallinarum]MBD8021025.1 LacI family DNA-binding transcriptional regulator [Brevibacterium gallinarum]
MRVRLEDVAEAAGVSVTTVSRVLGGRGTVAAATRTRVLDAVRDLGYDRSTLLHRQAARLVAVCAPAQPEHWQIEVCRSLSMQLQDAGIIAATPFLDEDIAEVRACIDAGAALVVTPTFTPLDVDVPVVRFAEATAAWPTATAGPEVSPASGTGSAGSASGTGRAGPEAGAGRAVDAERIAARVDLSGGMSLAFEHLHALGHRRIGLVCNDSGALAEQLKNRFRREHPMRDVTDRLDEWIAAVPKSHSGGIAAATQLRDATCTAVIVQSALQLHGVFAAVRRRRLAIPRDLSVVGFGDFSTMRYTNPPATVLRLDNQALAEALAAGVRSVLGLPGRQLASVPPTLRPRLLARQSTAAART